MENYKKILPLLIALFLAVVVYLAYRSWTKESKPEVTHEAVVEQIRLMGKIQLVQFNIRDVIEYKVKRNMFLPDSKVLLIVAGEIGACIDLQKLKDTDVKRAENKTTITLPKPEICYVKVNHERSKIYDKKSYILLDDDAELMDNTYKEAERFLNRPDVQEPAISEAIKNAPIILSPVFAKIASQPVVIRFESRPFLD